MGQIMIACIILHNMIVEDERDAYLNYTDPTEFMKDRATNSNANQEQGDEDADEDTVDPIFNFSTERVASLAQYMTNRDQLRNKKAHKELLDDLIEHIWENYSDDN